MRHPDSHRTHRQRRTHGFTLVELMVALFITAIMFTVGYRALAQALDSRKQLEEQQARLIAIQQALRTIEQDFELLTPRPVRNLLGDGYQPALTTSQTTTTTSGFGSSSSSSSNNSGCNGTSSSNSGSFSLGSSSGGSMGLSSGTGSGCASASSSSSSGAGSSSSSSGANNTPIVNGAPLVTLTRAGWTNPAGIQRSELQRVTYMIDNDTLIRAYYPVLDATASDALLKRTLLDHVKSFSIRFMDAGRQWRTDWPASAAALGAVAQQQSLRIRPVAVEVTLQLDDWGTLVRVIEIPG
jgi:type II secretion system protein J